MCTLLFSPLLGTSNTSSIYLSKKNGDSLLYHMPIFTEHVCQHLHLKQACLVCLHNMIQMKATKLVQKVYIRLELHIAYKVLSIFAVEKNRLYVLV